MNRSLSILCLHGVGLWPGAFGGVDLPWPITRVTRPGYDPVPPARDLGGQVDHVVDLIARHAPVVLVGVSGGATIALACASLGPAGLVGAVSHEPLVGALEPELDDRVRAAAERLETAPSASAAIEFLESLYGQSSWRRMPPAAHEFTNRHIDTICGEVRHFSEYQPSIEDVTNLPVPHLTTVGARSSAARHRVAGLLERGGSVLATVDDSGHHVLVDQPTEFAEHIRAFIEEKT